MVGLGRFELPTYGLGIQRAVLIGVENYSIIYAVSTSYTDGVWF